MKEEEIVKVRAWIAEGRNGSGIGLSSRRCSPRCVWCGTPLGSPNDPTGSYVRAWLVKGWSRPHPRRAVDHLRVTYKFQGRHYRLTDLQGRVAKEQIG